LQQKTGTGEQALRITRLLIGPLLASAALLAGATAAEPSPTTITLTLKDHRFTPDAVAVAAGQRVTVVVINQDAVVEEFDSLDLDVEKMIPPKGRASFTVGPLKPGSYEFMGELHANTARGVLTVSAGQ
jgi:plastocyanin